MKLIAIGERLQEILHRAEQHLTASQGLDPAAAQKSLEVVELRTRIRAITERARNSVRAGEEALGSGHSAEARLSSR